MDATIIAVSLIVDALAFGAVVHARRVVAQVRQRTDNAERAAHDFSVREEVQRQFWKTTAETWQKLYEEMRDALVMLQGEHTALLKAIAPEYVIQRANAALTGEAPEAEADTPSVTEADRRATAARRKQSEREQALRSGGYEPVVIGDSGAEPPHRLDATAHDDSDDS